MQGDRKRKRSDEESFSLMQDLPPGFRFRPTNRQLVSYIFLYNKVDHKDIKEYDLYGSTEPWHIWDMFSGPHLDDDDEEEEEDEEDIYFFTTLKKVNSQGSNFIRKVGTGSWQGEAKPIKIYDSDDSNKNCIGSMKRFRYENKNIPLQHGRWLLYEFNLDGFTLPSSSSNSLPCDLVVCHFRKKDKSHKRQKIPNQQNNNVPEPSSMMPSSSVMKDKAGKVQSSTSMQDDVGEVVLGKIVSKGNNTLESSSLVKLSSSVQEEACKVPSSSLMQDSMQEEAGDIESGGDELPSDYTWAQYFAQELLNNQTVCASQDILMIPNTFHVSEFLIY